LEQVSQAFTALANNTNGLRLIQDQAVLVLLFNFHQSIQMGNIAIVGKETFSYNETTSKALLVLIIITR
jgi:hypothetical protein